MPILTHAQETFNVNDYADFDRYQTMNSSLKASGVVPKVVLMGNSITEGWVDSRPDFFAKNDLIGRGIGGQVSHQMLLRFHADVIDLRPEVVVILVGTNDLAHNSGPVSIDQIVDNIRSMATLARSSGITVLLCSVLPASDFPWSPVDNPVPSIVDLNLRIKQYADDHDHAYVDYYSALVDDAGGLKVPDYTSADDLVHPNEEGYKVMEKVLLKTLKPIIE